MAACSAPLVSATTPASPIFVWLNERPSMFGQAPLAHSSPIARHVASPMFVLSTLKFVSAGAQNNIFDIIGPYNAIFLHA